MLDSQEVLGKAAGGRAKDLARDKRPHADRMRDLYLVALSRPASKGETAKLIAHIGKKDDAQSAYEGIVWALVNTREFLFDH